MSDRTCSDFVPGEAFTESATVFRWCVSESTPGYLPDMPVAVFETKAEASDYALQLKRELQEQGYKVNGTKLTGYIAERDKNDLGRVIEIYPYEPEFE